MKEAANLSFVTYEQKGFVGVITSDRQDLAVERIERLGAVQRQQTDAAAGFDQHKRCLLYTSRCV